MKSELVKENNGVFTREQLVELFDLTPYDDFDGTGRGGGLSDMNWEEIEERALYSYAYAHDYEFNEVLWEMTKECEECDGDGFDDEGRDCIVCEGEGSVEVDIDGVHNTDEYLKCYEEAEDPLYKGWIAAIETVIDRYFEHHDMIAEPVKVREYYESEGKRKSFLRDGYKIKPVEGKTWKDVAAAVIDTINGYGYFWFNTPKDLLDSYPYTHYKTAVMEHLHWIKHWGTVYGGYSPQHLYQREIESNLRNW